MISLYNGGDIIGKYVASIRVLMKETLAYIVLILRFGFFAMFILIAYYKSKNVTFIENDYVDTINMLLFGITNGYCTSCFMFIGPSKTEKVKEKELIGFIGGFFLTFGITCGTFLALPFESLTN